MKPKRYAEIRVCEVCRRPYRADRPDATARRCPVCAEKLAPRDNIPTPWGDTTECEVCGAVFSFTKAHGHARLCPECREISLAITRRDAYERWHTKHKTA